MRKINIVLPPRDMFIDVGVVVTILFDNENTLNIVFLCYWQDMSPFAVLQYEHLGC